MKVLLVLFTFILILSSASLAIYFNQNKQKAEGKLNRERYQRITAEEELQESQELNASLRQMLANTENKLNNVETILVQTRAMNSDLTTKLARTHEARRGLESELAQLRQTLEELKLQQEAIHEAAY